MNHEVDAMNFLCLMPLLVRVIGRLALWTGLACFSLSVWAQAQTADAGSGEVTLQSQYWVDEGGQASIEQVAKSAPAQFVPIDHFRSFALQKNSALWIRLDLPAMDAQKRWYLLMGSGTFVDRASLFQRAPGGSWVEQQSGDHLPVAQWSRPDQTPVFQLDLQNPSTVWLRLENQPTSIAPRLHVVAEETLQKRRDWTYLLLGGYLGFGLLVLFLGLVHARLYADRAFVAYSCYVACMLGFQVAFTGIGGLFFWPYWASWNNASPAIFMLLLTASGIWFVREACVLPRHHKGLDKAVLLWVGFGLVYTVIYTLTMNKSAFAILNLYGLLSVLLSIFLCLWTWRRGETYAGWLFLGFTPVHLGYPFPALRSVGILPDSWLTQYAVLIGSAIEIPLLLYILHLRAKNFSENRARMRAIDHTDPLTGLLTTPVLTLRVRDALRRSRKQKQSFAMMLIELANHAEIVSSHGRAMGDRALVVAASLLSSNVSEHDTVCRIDNLRFAVLVEGPVDTKAVHQLAQQIVARGLSITTLMPNQLTLRFRVVTALLPDASIENLHSSESELHHQLEPLTNAMNLLASEPQKAIVHLT
jgi:two-component system, sensor histidine kinase LadS